MYFNELDEIEPKEIMPGFWGKFIHTDKITLAFWDIKKGSLLPEHSHLHEQTAFLIEGEFQITIKEETKVLIPGMVAVIPSGAVHSGKALTDCKILDIFSPVREDYRQSAMSNE
ncbi:cupin domain-containing protein [soil metagenome]